MEKQQSGIARFRTLTESVLMAVRAIAAFALCTGREVRAEGVESLEQARWLQAEGCDAAQGFFFSKPIPANAFEAWLEEYEVETILADS